MSLPDEVFMNHPMARIALFLLALAGVPFLGGCGGPPPVSGDIQANEGRSQKLMALSAQEAGHIPDADMRLTRQLNLADLQIDRGWSDNARDTLTAARNTLGSPEAAKLNDQIRLSGWVSISQLSRRIHDMADAAIATDTALVELERIEDPAKRCEYVMGLANELQYIKGKPAAAALLAKAGPWTKWIDNLSWKRQALVAFATALFNLDDFDAGQKMVEQETHAAWRSDVLATMAQAAQEEQVQTVSGVPVAAAEARGFVTRGLSAGHVSIGPLVPANNNQPFFGKSLDYDRVFKNQKNAQTTQD
jgi:hypothetical protein